jgi:hypothetical protein
MRKQMVLTPAEDLPRRQLPGANARPLIQQETSKMQIKDLEIGKEYMLRTSRSRFKVLAFTSNGKNVAVEWEPGGSVGRFSEGDTFDAIEAPRQIDRFVVLLDDVEEGSTRIFSSCDAFALWLRTYPRQRPKIRGTAILRLTEGEFAFPIDAEQQESAA